MSPATGNRTSDDVLPEAMEPAEAARLRPHGEADEPLLSVTGAQLSPEELAAVTSLIAKLAGSEASAEDGSGTAGPADRTLQRRRRLGLWGRPGPDSWRHAAGLR